MEADMNDIIMLGIGHMETSPEETVLPTESYPVYLSEPLVVLYLSSLFAKYSWTTNEEIVEQAFASGKNNQTLGSEYEEAVLLLILHMFGGKACTLSDAFHTDQPWGSRKVTLVSLKRRSDGIMQSCPVSSSSGSSDRLGFKATSSEDVLSFLENPDGKCFLFPDRHMGPDLFFFLQDVETMELMGVPVQGKSMEGLDPAAWHRAVQTVTPEYFYTVKVLYLGAAEYKPPAVSESKMKLRSTSTLEKIFADKSQRKTPKILRIIATVDDKQDNRLRVAEGGDLGVLRWDRMQELLGSTIRDGLKKSLVP
jgi:hypothetical protein